MNKLFLICVLLFSLGGCVQKKIEKQKPAQLVPTEVLTATVTPFPTPISAKFNCDNKKTIMATFFNETVPRVHLVLSDNRTLDLNQAMSASGARYADEKEIYVFWNKGDTATFEDNGKMLFNNCVEETPLTGNDVDDHGCKGSAGYMWCEHTKKCIRIFEDGCSINSNYVSKCKKEEIYCPLTGKCSILAQTDCLAGNSNDVTEIKKLFLDKYKQNEKDFDVEINFDDGIHAVAIIKDLKLKRNDGLVFAYKTNNSWQIVTTGKGVILCDDLKNYPDYPASLIATCADGSGKEIVR